MKSDSEVPVFGVSESKKTDDKIRSICVNYMQLMLDCAKDEKIRNSFIKYPHYYLNEKVGMKIPKSVTIVLNAKTMGWPVLHVRAKDGHHYDVYEGVLSVDTLSDMKSEKTGKKVKTVDQAEVDVYLPEPLKGSEAVLTIPFIDVNSDNLSEIKFTDDQEIILSTA